ncbi:hypothetical protein ACJ41O_007358 [Fusarium nematophilum]
MSALPAYQEVEAPTSSRDSNLSAPFADLEIDPSPHNPDPDNCLAHLRLLFTFQSLKEDIGYTDGLWGLWDSRTDGNIMAKDDGGVDELAYTKNNVSDVEEKRKVLSKIREKRWAVFVARAVDRYQAWWNTLKGDRPLTEDDMDDKKSPHYDYFPLIEEPSYWEKQSLPPLDVLMVLHSHLLNPYNFLEDCMRRGYRRLWSSGFPWHLVNPAIDGSFSYNVSDDDKARWVAQTGREWENADDSLSKSMACPICTEPLEIPWTTCSLDVNPKTAERPGLTGSGYGDGKLDFRCPKCTTRITKNLLSVAKFCQDARDLIVKGHPMPGTILEPSTGKPDPWIRASMKWNFRTFPNRMIQRVLRIRIEELLKSPSPDDQPTIETVRKMIEDEVFLKQKSLHAICEGTTEIKLMRKTDVPRVAQICTRKMMSRYWDNFSIFALDLSGAIMRQGIFSEKICSIDWLHSPTAHETMKRLCTKYERFIKVIGEHPTKTAVPTLDLDLAWHTHQLSPFAYYKHTVRVTGKYIRHDDKIEDIKLGKGFEWTSKVYQETYVRISHVSSVGKALKLSKNDQVSEQFHESGAASLCAPDNSAHVSSHNAVRMPDNPSLTSSHVQKIQIKLHERRLEENYRKACKRAGKKGRKLPPKEQYYDHWGYHYYTVEDLPPLEDVLLEEDVEEVVEADAEVVVEEEEAAAVEGAVEADVKPDIPVSL